MKVPFVTYADLECLLEKMHSCQNNFKKPYTEKKFMHTPSGHSLFTQSSFHSAKDMLDCYSGKGCMERFCKDLKEHATKIINYEKKEMIPLTDEENKSYKKQKVCYICKKRFSTDDERKVRDHCHCTRKYRGAAYDTCNLRYKTPKEIPAVFHNGSTYDYHFIIKELAKKI